MSFVVHNKCSNGAKNQVRNKKKVMLHSQQTHTSTSLQQKDVRLTESDTGEMTLFCLTGCGADTKEVLTTSYNKI